MHNWESAAHWGTGTVAGSEGAQCRRPHSQSSADIIGTLSVFISYWVKSVPRSKCSRSSFVKVCPTSSVMRNNESNRSPPFKNKYYQNYKIVQAPCKLAELVILPDHNWPLPVLIAFSEILHLCVLVPTVPEICLRGGKSLCTLRIGVSPQTLPDLHCLLPQRKRTYQLL